MKFLFYLFVVYTTVFSFLSIRNHDLYQTFAWDFGFFDQLIWQASRGNVNFVSTVGNLNMLGDHFQPILYLLAPFYWILDNERILLVLQTVIVAAAAFPLYLLFFKKTQNRLFSLVSVLAYWFFSGTQYTITNEFHQSCFIPLILSGGIYFIELRKTKPGFIILMSLMLVREDMALLSVALGFMYLIIKKVKLGASLMLFGMAGFFLIINIIIPSISNLGRYSHYDYGELGKTPEEVVVKILEDPPKTLKMLVTPEDKPKQVFNAMFSFGGLPFLGPIHLLPILQQYGIRFIDTRTIHRWLDKNHYASPIGPLMAIATVEGVIRVGRLMKIKAYGKFYFVVSCYLLLSISLSNVLLKNPIFSIFKSQLYYTPDWARDVDIVVESFSDDRVIATNNSIFPHLSHRDKIYLLPDIRDADYIIIDLANGPNKYAPLDYVGMMQLFENLTRGGDWIVERREGRTVVLERI